ncbi:Glycosyltransferase KanE [Limihaloglobus sulfuriphilus]|uniref:Glycosyltransferase KanE n=1 Tax=Limihaloglobus sulfuriphilus TaxID=1851148 RepID=A0A1Q2MIW5_9BACT|nr:glycosyltransferase family 4 protein [Limihaloglobus sulfuriphilus]AQQ72287.1 Glycosyltransferase KanE [Limihaloglobus sulfuriphilus]
MKIVHIITRLVIGGAQENTLITCREQKKDGHEVTLITGDDRRGEGTLIETAKAWGIEVINVPQLVRQIRPCKELKGFFALKSVLRDLDPDIIHTHSAKAGILGRAAGAAIRRKTDNGRHRPLIVHGVHGLPFHEYQPAIINWIYILLERHYAKKTDAYVCVADTMAEKSLARGIGSKDMYTTAYSAMEVEEFLQPPQPETIAQFREKYNIPQDAKVIVKIARLADLKGHEYVIQSARELAEKHPDCIWLFVGSGLLEAKLRDMIDAANLTDRFRFTGLLEPSMIPLVIHSSDILVHCSLREGLARVLPQSLLCATPAVSFDIDGAKEVINENTGFLLPPRDIPALVDACDKLLSDEDLRKQLGKNGQDLVREMFTPRRMAQTVEAVYRSII